MANLIGNEEYVNTEKFTQVYSLTHNKAGKLLPYYEKNFISFSYGGKFIEDFDLIVATDGDRINRQIYAQFEDNIETHEILDGQIYWGSHFTNNRLELTLATDGISEKKLDEFKHWFSPGESKELILSEHPNRCIQARIAEPPNYSFLPFESKAIFYGKEISTTLYKGEIKLNFIMDEPYWYSKMNYMPNYVNRITLEALSEENIDKNKITTKENKDTLKIMLEDGIPHQSVLDTGNNVSTFFLGGSIVVSSISRVGQAIVGTTRLGIVTEEKTGLSVSSIIPQYLFYSGTAKCKPIIKFSMKPKKNNDGYITHPSSKFLDQSAVYSNIKVGNKIFEFTTPSILTGYNTALKIIKNSSNNISFVDLLNTIKEEVKENYSRAWAIKCINQHKANKLIVNNTIKNNILNDFKNFIDVNNDMTFTFDSKTGEAIGNFIIKTASNNDISIEEKVGDMVCSDYITIEERNYLNSNGEITIDNCHKILSNEELTDFFIFYKNMYL